MLSLIEVKCPHCGAQGQIMLPPLGAIIVGPCPECQGMVVVFCGRVMPLDKDVMTQGSPEERQEHLMGVLNVFLHERVKRLFTSTASAEAPEPDAPIQHTRDDLGEHHDESILQRPGAISIPGKLRNDPITDDEINNFVNIDLKLIDNVNYFRAVFD